MYGPGTGRLGLACGCRRRRRRWIPTVHALLPSAPAAGRRRNGGCQDIGRSPTAVPGGGPRRALVRCRNGHVAAISRKCWRCGSVRRALFRKFVAASRERPISGWEIECGLKSVSRPLEIHTAGGRNPSVENSNTSLEWVQQNEIPKRLPACLRARGANRACGATILGISSR